MKKKKTHVIFLVEDDQVFSKTLELHLKEHLKHKIEILTFSSGEECLKNIHLKPTIVVLDYYLNSQNPKAQNGLEILKKIKQAEPDTEVIMLSVQDKIEVAVNSMMHGAYNYLTKNEVAFFRVQNTINNIIKIIQYKRDSKSAQRGIVIILIVIGILIAFVSYITYKFPWVLNY